MAGLIDITFNYNSQFYMLIAAVFYPESIAETVFFGELYETGLISIRDKGFSARILDCFVLNRILYLCTVSD